MEREHRTPGALREVLPSSDRMRAFLNCLMTGTVLTDLKGATRKDDRVERSCSCAALSLSHMLICASMRMRMRRQQCDREHIR